MEFYICQHCGNLITFLDNKGVPVMCCGQKMTLLVPGTVDASLEKHVPVVTVEGQTVAVKVGAAEHPMVEEHYITWIAPGLPDQVSRPRPEARGRVHPGRRRRAGGGLRLL